MALATHELTRQFRLARTRLPLVRPLDLQPLAILALTFVVHTAVPAGAPPALAGALTLESPNSAHAHFEFGGVISDRIQANVSQWLLTAPQANPGLLGMFEVRDRHPVPALVPWAGEFVGKYLLASIQALRMTDDPRLRLQVSNVVAAFITTQAEDGYLGPFPKDIRLLKNWDLWGHYHAIQALLAWHEQTGDPSALAAARRAGDLVCRTYLNTGRRVLEAGDPEMNMSILTGLAMLHRFTGESRYLEMAREVEKDWEKAGDYLRSGLDGREFYQSPRPRWESLHDLQGLAELWRITGDTRYRDSFVHHWRSIRRWDRRNTGGFSSGEQATGNPYSNTAIETCCTVAWMALTLDYLRITGDPSGADDLELATFNGGLGAQHPSGRWWTYNTPMDGTREASAHTIVFQSRAGTPEFNCCSANAPRVLGILSEWAIQTTPDGVVINWLAPMNARMKLADGGECQLTVTGGHPVSGTVRISLRTTPPAREMTLRLRIPGWAGDAAYELKSSADTDKGHAAAGTYLQFHRSWNPADELVVTFTETLRAVAGANEMAGKVSLYRGPLLLAYDQKYNSFDADKLPPIELSRLAEAKPVASSSHTPQSGMGSRPWLLIDMPASRGGTVRLVDFANAGADGTDYRSWLVARQPPATPAFTCLPADGAHLPPGMTQFRWQSKPPRMTHGTTPPAAAYRIEFARDPYFQEPLPIVSLTGSNRIGIDIASVLAGNSRTTQPTDLYWRVASLGETTTLPDVPPSRLVVDPAAPAQQLPPEPTLGPDGELIRHSLRGQARPDFGTLSADSAGTAGPDGTALDSRDKKLLYPIAAWPQGDFTVAVRVRVSALPGDRLGQVFSAWTAGGDDPLRLVIDNGKLYARMETSGGASTPGIPIEAERWRAVAAVKSDSRLSLYLDGQEVASTSAPALVTTTSQLCALGGNPRYSGDEHLAATFADFGFWARALAPSEIAALAKPPAP